MYPKVKVRAAELDDDYDRPISPLRDFNSVSIRDFGHPGKERKHAFSPSVAKVPKSYVPMPMTPPHSFPKAAKKSEQEIEDCSKPLIRASSVPRPRAVISSPDNDQILRSKIRTRMERTSAMKSQNMAPCRHPTLSRHSEGRSAPSITARKPSRRAAAESKVTVHTSDHSKGKKGLTIDVRVPRANIVKAKPCFTIT